LAFMQPQLIQAVAARANLSEAEADRALSALEEILLEEVFGAVTRRLTGLIHTALGIDSPELSSKQPADKRPAIAARSKERPRAAA
jgi:hypothetical protein